MKILLSFESMILDSYELFRAIFNDAIISDVFAKSKMYVRLPYDSPYFDEMVNIGVNVISPNHYKIARHILL